MFRIDCNKKSLCFPAAQPSLSYVFGIHKSRTPENLGFLCGDSPIRYNTVQYNVQKKIYKTTYTRKYVTHKTQCAMHNNQHTPSTIRSTKYSTQNTLHNAQYTTPYTVHSTPHAIHNTQHTIHSTPYTTHITQYTALVTRYYTRRNTQYTIYGAPGARGNKELATKRMAQKIFARTLWTRSRLRVLAAKQFATKPRAPKKFFGAFGRWQL